MLKIIKRFNFVAYKLHKGEEYLNSPLITEVDKEKGLISFNKLLLEVQELTVKITEMRGCKISKEEFNVGIEV